MCFKILHSIYHNCNFIFMCTTIWLMSVSSTRLKAPKDVGFCGYFHKCFPNAEHWPWSIVGSHRSLVHEWWTNMNVYKNPKERDKAALLVSTSPLFKESTFDIRQTWGPVFTLPCASYLILGKILNFSRGSLSSSVKWPYHSREVQCLPYRVVMGIKEKMHA